MKINSPKPIVSIGMPVFNGEKYLNVAIESILAQAYEEFELIISDNASTDNTKQICREYAAKDNRIHYSRNEKNIGGPANFNRTFEIASGEYFRWAAHDDVLAPEYLQKCVSVLDKDPSVVLCHCITGRIDARGTLLGVYNQGLSKRTCSNKPHERFGNLIPLFHFCCPVMGLIRTSSLRKTPLIGSYVGSDRNLLAEVGLMGRIYEIPEVLFFQRDHPGSYSSTRKWPYTSVDDLRTEMSWWSKGNWTSFPHWKNCIEYFRSVNRVELKISERLLCYNQILKWFMKEGWRFISSDLENFLLFNSNVARTLFPIIHQTSNAFLSQLSKK
jgi:glycosyltransferase involved in cell wall biosynthesis